MFPSKDEALEFLEDWDLDEARIKLLLEQNRILEASAVHAGKGDVLKAVEMLSTVTARDVDVVRRMVKYLLTGLRPGFTLETTPSSFDSTISRLLVLADQLDKATVAEQGFDEVGTSHPLNREITHSFTSSLRCIKRFTMLTTQLSARLPGLFSRWGTILLLCFAWTTSSRPLPSSNTSRFPRLGHQTPSTLTISIF